MKKFLLLAFLALGALSVEITVQEKHDHLKPDRNLRAFLKDQKEERIERIQDVKADLRAEDKRDAIKAKDARRRARENKEIKVEQRLREVELAQEERDREDNNRQVNAEQAKLRAQFVQRLVQLNKKYEAEYRKEAAGLKARAIKNDKVSAAIDAEYKDQNAERLERVVENKQESIARNIENKKQNIRADIREEKNEVAAAKREENVRRNNAEQKALRAKFEAKLAREAEELEDFFRAAAAGAQERKIENKEETREFNQTYREQNMERKVRAEHIDREIARRNLDNKKRNIRTAIREEKISDQLEREHRALARNDRRQAQLRNQFERDLDELRQQLRFIYGKQRKQQIRRAIENKQEHREFEAENRQRDFENKLIAANKAKRAQNDKIVANIERRHDAKDVKVENKVVKKEASLLIGEAA